MKNPVIKHRFFVVDLKFLTCTRRCMIGYARPNGSTPAWARAIFSRRRIAWISAEAAAASAALFDSTSTCALGSEV